MTKYKAFIVYQSGVLRRKEATNDSEFLLMWKYGSTTQETLNDMTQW